MRRLVVFPLAAVTFATAAQADPAADVSHWQAQLAQDSSLPQEGYLDVDKNGNAIGNDYWGKCNPSPTFAHTVNCPDAGTPTAEAFVLQVRQNIARDRTQLAAAEARLG